MPFRKKSHEANMPAFVWWAIGDRFSLPKGFPISTLNFDDQAKYKMNLSDLREADRIERRHVEAVLRIGWKNVVSEDVDATIEALEAGGFFDKIDKHGWEPRRPPPGPGPKAIVSGPSPRWEDVYLRGKCPLCGFMVANPRRHGNTQHTREDCRKNQVRGVMES